jgi:plasmid replication initiation protein
MSENALCVMDNKLIEGNFKLSAVECRLIMHTIGRIGKEDDAFKTYEYTGRELIEALGIGENNNRYLIDVIEGLMKKTVRIRRPKSYLIANWLGGETEVFDDGRISIRFGEKLKPYLLQLKEQFTVLQLESMMKFNSIYASRIYMLCKQYERIGTRTIALQELREILQIKDEYKQFIDLKKRVLEPAEREINLHSDIRVQIEPDTKNRIRKSYKNLIFNIQPAVREPKKKVTTSKAEDRINKKHVRDVAAFKKLPEEEQKFWMNMGMSNAFFIPGAEEEFAVSAWINNQKEEEQRSKSAKNAV